ncbi:MAG TPA: phosphoglucosamine mutase [Steroidobacteraceae bacterium]|nr:phosphoglucosamine mutase [Steroidobacteraceae bacterium]
MARKYFGTDGVRGKVGEAPMTVDFTLRLASAAARVLAPEGGKVIIGKDTRVSGYMFESALEAGFVAAGVDVWLTGPIPTPGVAYLIRHKGDSFGVVISASHNPFDDNGIKFFDRTGEKLSDELEERIEEEMDRGVQTRASNRLGKARNAGALLDAYQDFCATTVPGGFDLTGMKLVIDCANGAGFKVGPRLLAALGAEIIPVGCSPNGRNINDACGSTSPGLLQLTVPGVGATAGIALDGDGDRLVMVDHLGRTVDGDQLLYIIARDRAARGELAGPVVGTLMSNLGLEVALRELGIGFHRANVGDRYVLAMLKEQGGTIGGETSGHILCLDRTTTGDALVAALQVLDVMRRTGQSLAQLAAGMSRFPQVLINVRVAQRFDPQAEPSVAAATEQVRASLGDEGRVVLRASGTEPVIRVMVEAREKGTASAAAERIAAAVRAVSQ